MEMKPGYKMTEVGVIPEDWDVKPLGKLLKRMPSYGINAPAIPYDSRFPTYLRITDITEDGRFAEATKVSVDHPAAASFMLERGDIVFARTGASVGKSYLYNLSDGTLIFAGFLIRVSPDFQCLDPDYLSYFVQTKHYWSWILTNSMRSGQPGVNGREYASLPIPLPPTKAEQEAIAKALSDADALIESLEQLIAKKRNIKQGAMQELLRAKEGWHETTLFELASGSKDYFDDGDWIEAEHITDEGVRLVQTGNIGIGCFIEKEVKKYIFEKSYEKLRCKEIKQGDLMICRLAEPAGRACVLPNINENKIITSVDVSIFRPPLATVNRVFLAALFSTDQWFRDVSDRSGGTTHKRISRGALGRIVIKLPIVEEQNVIARIFSDMDAELATLEAKLSKARQVKQGMMQELLTGKVRLI
jgi:type I restriction enzyme S subunit